MSRTARRLWSASLVLSLLFYATSCHVGSAGFFPSTTRANQRANAVAITVICDGETKGRGSGAVIAPAAVLTATHVIDACLRPLVLVQTAAGEDALMFVGGVDEEGDVAMLVRAFGVFSGPFPARGPAPKVDDVLCTSTAVPLRQLKCGHVDELFAGADGVATEAQTSFLVDFGNSGSGVYDSRGRIVGVVTQTLFIQVSPFQRKDIASKIDLRIDAFVR